MSDEELYGEILRALEIDHQYVAHFEPTDIEQIARVRSLGRRAGRHFGWKVRTFQTDPGRREDRKVVVIVTVIESTSEERAPRAEFTADSKHEVVTYRRVVSLDKSIIGSEEQGLGLGVDGAAIQRLLGTSEPEVGPLSSTGQFGW